MVRSFGKDLPHPLALFGGGYPNIASLCVARHMEDGSIRVGLERRPSRKRIVFLPFPGGHLKFFLLYDEETSRYFAASNVSTDSAVRLDRLDPERFGFE